jgi:hypothetical protein
MRRGPEDEDMVEDMPDVREDARDDGETEEE